MNRRRLATFAPLGDLPGKDRCLLAADMFGQTLCQRIGHQRRRIARLVLIVLPATGRRLLHGDLLTIHDQLAETVDHDAPKPRLRSASRPAKLQFGQPHRRLLHRLLPGLCNRPPCVPRDIARHGTDQFQFSIEQLGEQLFPVRGLLLDLLPPLHLRRILGRRGVLRLDASGILGLRRDEVGRPRERHRDGHGCGQTHSPAPFDDVHVDDPHGAPPAASRPRSKALK